MKEIKCPTCPICGSAPGAGLLGISPLMAQCFCVNEDCAVLLWDPWVSLDENLLNAGTPTITGE